MAERFLRPCYDDHLRALENAGYETVSTDAEMDEFMATLIKLNKKFGLFSYISGIVT